MKPFKAFSSVKEAEEGRRRALEVQQQLLQQETEEEDGGHREGAAGVGYPRSSRSAVTDDDDDDDAQATTTTTPLKQMRYHPMFSPVGSPPHGATAGSPANPMSYREAQADLIRILQTSARDRELERGRECLAVLQHVGEVTSQRSGQGIGSSGAVEGVPPSSPHHLLQAVLTASFDAHHYMLDFLYDSLERVDVMETELAHQAAMLGLTPQKKKTAGEDDPHSSSPFRDTWEERGRVRSIRHLLRSGHRHALQLLRELENGSVREHTNSSVAADAAASSLSQPRGSPSTAAPSVSPSSREQRATITPSAAAMIGVERTIKSENQMSQWWQVWVTMLGDAMLKKCNSIFLSCMKYVSSTRAAAAASATSVFQQQHQLRLAVLLEKEESKRSGILMHEATSRVRWVTTYYEHREKWVRRETGMRLRQCYQQQVERWREECERLEVRNAALHHRCVLST